MTEYVTTNIRLPKEMHRALKQRALDEEKSLAQIIRESVVQYLASPTGERTDEQEALRRAEFEADPLWLIGTDPVYSDITDASVNLDLYLYGPLSEAAKAEIRDE
ncbi:MAG: ribbon-helix-helix protein, CopG family [Anaerolineae bacterium]